ncbi:unnamed protein product [Rotaria sp. Silwood1]|nr:unnamed protein product [Rotaria sp. Silwood1]
MSNTTMISTVAVTLNFILLIETINMSLICILMIFVLLPSIIRHHDVVLVLAANNYLALLAFAIVAISSNVDMVRGDYNLYTGMETFSCRIKGYTVYSFMAVIFNTFALQEIFLEMKSDQQVMKDLVGFCKEEYNGNTKEIEIVNEFDSHYESSNAI